MQDIQRTISNANAHKSPLWLLLQRDSLFYPSELACHTPQGSAIQLPTPPLEIYGHAIRGRTRKTVIKVDGARRTLEAMSKGLISYTVQNIEGTPKPSRASVCMKSTPISTHTGSHGRANPLTNMEESAHNTILGKYGYSCGESDTRNCHPMPISSHGNGITHTNSNVHQSKHGNSGKRRNHQT